MEQTVIIKCGGSVLQALEPSFFERLRDMQKDGKHIILVHGGGPAITKYMNVLSIPTEFINGVRRTSVRAAETAEMVLAGQLNPWFVYQLNQLGLKAIGINGNDGALLECDYLKKEEWGHVGKILKVNRGTLTQLIKAGFVPVIASVSRNLSGEILNLNADTVAFEVASAMEAESLIFVTDVDGIMAEGKTVQKATIDSINELIDGGIITGGMIPKVHAAINCLKSKIKEIQIVGKEMKGTLIVKEEVLS
ncbi:acetylglutamate kinase [Fictibacillus terranigra]|uniref:Acetylglutamate kinase n=1 Tax=Fictibacillus terranigra TaxID=3058424 RepID=A0ABT8E740_9BACL|nr:acetylglutamate kinase [Fictibacillus sp. CENA-BCM004]MDN4073718.1 acetylglutamate kinase [Fictibacillus sp. CENA-BCM004]